MTQSAIVGVGGLVSVLLIWLVCGSRAIATTTGFVFLHIVRIHL
eukprot:UN11668